ncbi:hypothetical protein KZZ52_55900 [Dactylosporangium sp. AC04546]|uniref:CysS/YqeB C-terminal domain-containing protein n=1 Tax=Dactylosporangium sp. AC04546 TaxID=2862460 RepID=UPI001EDCCE1B|nr:hypothetical protein [Dactylosporangium sp. AC04546]WVK83109.1 hypothetical protein KZZ52_55900 [Dactylosporangium sp. AC04546]
MTGLLVIMGSGETAPTMVKPHREIFERCGDRPAVLLDTPYGFQENADDISTRALKYFADSTGRSVKVASWRTTPPPGLDRERALADLRSAGWLFAGPGSPTYALRQWTDTEIPVVLREAVARDAVVLFASAAALTLSSHTIPVYEIYKVGAEPAWAPGLDLIRPLTGLPAVIIPHYDNAEGGHHDTRFCYLGERRLRMLEPELPEDSFILGVDEHTAAVFDPAASTVRVLGNGGLTLRRSGGSRWWPSGTLLPFTAFTGATPPSQSSSSSSGAAGLPPSRPSLPATSLGAETLTAVTRFDTCYESRDVDGCVAAALALEQAMHDWIADTDVSDEREQARSALRRMLVRLGGLAGTERLTPLVTALVALRTAARESKDWALSDALRDAMQTAGVSVQDTPAGPVVTY